MWLGQNFPSMSVPMPAIWSLFRCGLYSVVNGLMFQVSDHCYVDWENRNRDAALLLNHVAYVFYVLRPVACIFSNFPRVRNYVIFTAHPDILK